MPDPTPADCEFAYAGQQWRWRRRGQPDWHGGYATYDEALTAAQAAAATVPVPPAEEPQVQPAGPAKGHWPKGKPRNLRAGQVATAKSLMRLLRLAIERPWRHPTLGVLSYRVVAAKLQVDPKTVHRWTKCGSLPPAWALDEIRELIREFKE